MKVAGQFNINDYLNKLYEAEESGGVSGDSGEGLIIPSENKKSYDWLQKEYNKGKTEVKVEIKMGGAKFEPGYDLQTDLKSVKDFKPGMYGDVKTSDTEGSKKNKPGSTAGSLGSSGDAPKEDKEEKKGVQVKGATAGVAKKEDKDKKEDKKEEKEDDEG